ncbi:hypothetical protein G6O69_01550 [Pseudenhygromyxa sp. WMMC2535]|nr:hypothetical protein [Pseudenhygromyxa sp. WMMC2535]
MRAFDPAFRTPEPKCQLGYDFSVLAFNDANTLIIDTTITEKIDRVGAFVITFSAKDPCNLASNGVCVRFECSAQEHRPTA